MKDKKGFATLPFLIFIVLYFLFLINNFYYVEEPIMEKLMIIQTAIKTAEIEEIARAASEEVVSSYKELAKINPALIKVDEEHGYRVLKHFIIKNIEEKHHHYLKTSQEKINFTCFCTEYNYEELKEVLQESAKFNMLIIPAKAKHIGSCNESISIIVNNLEDIKIILTKDNIRFFCFLQHNNVVYIEIVALELKLRNRNNINEELMKDMLNYLNIEYGKQEK